MKKITIMLSALCLAAGLPSTVKAQAPELTLDATTPDMSENEPRPVFPVPSARQLKWNQTEFYAFFHYGMNTYTDEEWGSGAEDESKFAPTQAPNPKQWLQAIKDGGMKGGIAVVKHHDGFCLWPTATTEHSVKNAGNQFGKDTNIPRDFAKAAQELGLKYGFYISPWTLAASGGVLKIKKTDSIQMTTQRRCSSPSAKKLQNMVLTNLKCGLTVLRVVTTLATTVVTTTTLKKLTRMAMSLRKLAIVPLTMPTAIMTFLIFATKFTKCVPTSSFGV